MKDHNAEDDVSVDDLIVIVRSIGKEFDQKALRRTRTELLKLWRELAVVELRKLKPSVRSRRR